MCGMVGTKRFKFDVFSNDVTLANEMESSGVAGRVHISDATAGYLDNQYILEEGPDYKGWLFHFSLSPNALSKKFIRCTFLILFQQSFVEISAKNACFYFCLPRKPPFAYLAYPEKWFKFFKKF